MRVAFVALMVSLLFAGGRGASRPTRDVRPAQARSVAARVFTRRPPVILWAWQRPEDLSFIDPRRTGVSYLVETIQLKGSAVIVQPNTNSLKVPAGAWVMMCARIETDEAPRPTFSFRQASDIAHQLTLLARFPGAQAVQIDFDSTASQRDFYRQILVQIRKRLPSSFPLSITALASWCMGDDWISQLPVSEAVPMLFRMGPDRSSILLHLQAGGDFQEPLCRTSAGISTDEIAPRLPAGRSLYIFNPEGWTKPAFEAIMDRIK